MFAKKKKEEALQKSNDIVYTLRYFVILGDTTSTVYTVCISVFGLGRTVKQD